MKDTPFRREDALARMQEVMGPLPGDERGVPADVRITEEHPAQNFLRRKITFATEPGDRVIEFGRASAVRTHLVPTGVYDSAQAR